MLYEKKKGRTRIVKFGKDDWFESESGAKFPIKSKPMIFTDMYQEFIQDMETINTTESKRVDALLKGEEFDLEEFAQKTVQYLDNFYEIVITVSNFNGWDIDVEFIKSNMGFTDPYWYMQSVTLGKPIYDFDSKELKKKK